MCMIKWHYNAAGCRIYYNSIESRTLLKITWWPILLLNVEENIVFFWKAETEAAQHGELVSNKIVNCMDYFHNPQSYD